MSTKVSMKQRSRTAQHPGFHLYEDVLDDLAVGAVGGAGESPVYLRLDGVAAELQTLSSGGVSVTVELPRETARVLGLLPPEPPQEQLLVRAERL